MKNTIFYIILFILSLPQLKAQTITKEEKLFFDALIEAKSNPKEYKLVINNYALAKCLNDESLASSDNNIILELNKLKTNDKLREQFYGIVNYFYTSDKELISEAFQVTKTVKKSKINLIDNQSMDFVNNLIINNNYYSIKHLPFDEKLNSNSSVDIDNSMPIAETLAIFPGGDAALFEYIRNQTHYPQIENDHNITGKIMLRFVVEKDGTLSNIVVIKSISTLIDHEGMRVIKMMPLWKPATNNGKPVRMYYNLPMNFTLK